eukprot:4520483-Pyramimonas_sp.AAC.1
MGIAGASQALKTALAALRDAHLAALAGQSGDPPASVGDAEPRAKKQKKRRLVRDPLQENDVGRSPEQSAVQG